MSLPSKYSRDGLSANDQHRTITTGTSQRRIGPSTYNVRLALANYKPTVEDEYFEDEAELLPPKSKQNRAQSTELGRLHHLQQWYEYELKQKEQEQEHKQRLKGKHSNNPYKSTSSNLSQALQYLVVDTNFMLSHLDILVSLMEICTQYLQLVIIPNEVIHELDGLKNSQKVENHVNSSKSIGQLARQANDWIYFCLAEGKLTVRGQADHERVDPMLIKDEAILDCCVYFRDQYPKSLTVLLSNDKNLCAKSLSNLIPTVSYREGMSAKRIATTVYTEFNARFGAVKDTIGIDPAAQSKGNSPHSHPPHNSLNYSSSSPSPSADPAVVFVTIHKEIKQLAISAVKRAISDAYGPDCALLQGYDESAITTLYMAAKMITRFWRQVFMQLLPNCRPYVVISNKLEPIMFEVPENLDQLHKFIDFWFQILSLLYEKLMPPDQLQALHLLKKRWDQLANRA